MSVCPVSPSLNCSVLTVHSKSTQSIRNLSSKNLLESLSLSDWNGVSSTRAFWSALMVIWTYRSVRSCLKAILVDTVPACEYRRIPGWKIKWRIGWSVHSVCRLLGRVSIRLFIHELWLRCNNVLYIISIFYHTQSSLSDTIVFPQRSIARIVISARQSSVIHQIDWTRVEIFCKASVLSWIIILFPLVY